MLPFVGTNFQESNVPRNRRCSQCVIEPLQDHPNDVQENLISKTMISHSKPHEQYYPATYQVNDDRIFLTVEVPQKKELEHTRVYEVYGQRRNTEYSSRGYFKVELDSKQTIKNITMVYVGLGVKNFISYRTKEELINRTWDNGTLKLAVHSLREEFAGFAAPHPKSMRSLHIKILLEMFKKFFHDVENAINENFEQKNCEEKVLVKFTDRGTEIIGPIDECAIEESSEKANSAMQHYNQVSPSDFTGCVVGNDGKHFHNDHHVNRRDSLCNCTEFREQLEHLRLHSHFHSLEHVPNEASPNEPFKMREYVCPTVTGDSCTENDVTVVLPNLLKTSLMNSNPFNKSSGTSSGTGVTGSCGTLGPGLPVSLGKEGLVEMMIPFETIRFHVMNGNLTAIVNPHMEETQMDIMPGNPKLLQRRESIPLLHERTTVLDGRLEHNKRFKPTMFWTADGEHHYHNLNPIRGVHQNRNTHLFHNFSIDHKFAMASVAQILAEKSQISLKGLAKKQIPNSSLKNTRSIQKVFAEEKAMPNERISATGERRCSVQSEPRLYGKGLAPITLPESGEHIKSKLWSDLRVGPGSMNRNRIKEQGVKTVYKLMAITQATAMDTNKKLANITNIANKFAVYKRIAYML